MIFTVDVQWIFSMVGTAVCVIALLHEVGHILGLPDSSSGAMNGVYMIGSPVVSPTVAEIATVRRLWGME